MLSPALFRPPLPKRSVQLSSHCAFQRLTTHVVGDGTTVLALGITPRLVEAYTRTHHIPGVASGTGHSGISVFSLNLYIFGGLIVLFLMLQPRGLAAMWLRAKAYFRSWPFSY